jgi:hypothetical protein
MARDEAWFTGDLCRLVCLNDVVPTTAPFACRNGASVNGSTACWGRYILIWSIVCGLVWRDNGEEAVSPVERLCNIHNIWLTDTSSGSLESSVQSEVAFVRFSDVFCLFWVATSSVSLPARLCWFKSQISCNRRLLRGSRGWNLSSALRRRSLAADGK